MSGHAAYFSMYLQAYRVRQSVRRDSTSLLPDYHSSRLGRDTRSWGGITSSGVHLEHLCFFSTRLAQEFASIFLLGEALSIRELKGENCFMQKPRNQLEDGRV